MKFRTAYLLSILVLLLLAAPQLSLAAPQQDSAQKDDELPTFRANVNVVNLFFNVKDKHGALIPNLTKDDFQVFEDGKQQTIKYFSAESDQPLTLGILIDTSGSQTGVLPMEKEAGAEFLRDVLRPKDLAFVISFDVNVDLLQDFTNSHKYLRRALDSAKINSGGAGGGLPGMGGGPFPTSSNPRGTLLYDAIYLGSHEKLASEVGRKAMIILTDGEDQGSQLKIKDAIEAAQKSDAICYVILIADRGFYSSYGGGYGGDREMKKLTLETGGRVVDVGDKFDKLKKAFAEISAELRSQYSIGYTPTNAKLDGSFRRIEIKTNHDYRVQARKGYYATKAQTGD
ncbi:MAG: VWA domain-containing protein [Terriglobales bacterium]